MDDISISVQILRTASDSRSSVRSRFNLVHYSKLQTSNFNNLPSCEHAYVFFLSRHAPVTHEDLPDHQAPMFDPLSAGLQSVESAQNSPNRDESAMRIYFPTTDNSFDIFKFTNSSLDDHDTNQTALLAELLPACSRLEHLRLMTPGI